MTDDRSLAERIRQMLAAEADVTEDHLSGSLMFRINGVAAVTVSALGGLVVRVPVPETSALVDEHHIRRVEMDGFTIDGWVRVDTVALETDNALRAWVAPAVTLTRSLDPGGS